MASYLILKRIKEDRVYLPNEVLVDPPNVGTLIKRGYLIPVPDDYIGAVSAPPQSLPSAELDLSGQAPVDSPTPPEEPEAPEEPPEDTEPAAPDDEPEAPAKPAARDKVMRQPTETKAARPVARRRG